VDVGKIIDSETMREQCEGSKADSRSSRDISYSTTFIITHGEGGDRDSAKVKFANCMKLKLNRISCLDFQMQSMHEGIEAVNGLLHIPVQGTR
jgi:hypothetical protein